MKTADFKLRQESPLVSMWPVVFTSICLLLFVLPSFMLIYISRQPATDYLGSNWTSITVVIPVVLALVHWHQHTNGPNKFAMIAGLAIPSLILVILGEKQQQGAGSNVQSLFSIDCEMLSEKAELQLEWEAAQAFWSKCTNDTVAKSKPPVTSAFITQHFRIQDCTDYKDALALHPTTWPYLQSLEENYACTGFCTPGQQLWSKGPHKDSCSVALSKIYQYLVLPRAGKVMMTMFAVLLASLAGAAFL